MQRVQRLVSFGSFTHFFDVFYLRAAEALAFLPGR
jgi:hypothetical protein